MLKISEKQLKFKKNRIKAKKPTKSKKPQISTKLRQLLGQRQNRQKLHQLQRHKCVVAPAADHIRQRPRVSEPPLHLRRPELFNRRVQSRREVRQAVALFARKLDRREPRVAVKTPATEILLRRPRERDHAPLEPRHARPAVHFERSHATQ